MTIFIGCLNDNNVVPQADNPGEPGQILAASYITPLGSAGLDERVFDADVIARARLVGTEAAAERSGTNEDGAELYRGLVKFRFEVLEYIKGAGEGEIVVEASVEMMAQVIAEVMDKQRRGETVYWYEFNTENPFTTMQTALEAAEFWERQRDTRWDGREAIILVREAAIPGQSGGAGRFSFGPIFGYGIESGHRLWLPASLDDDETEESAEETRFLLEAPNRDAPHSTFGTRPDEPATISVSEIESLIARLDEWSEDGEGVDGYQECIRQSFIQERIINGHKERGESLSSAYDFYLDSGSPAETIIEDGHPVTGRIWIEGDDKAYLSYENGSFSILRPLPAGRYLVYYNYQASRWIPCNYLPDEYINSRAWIVNVTAPDGVLHEAFFDPVEIGPSLGANASNGVLEPASFEAGPGELISIDSIEWEPQEVTMSVSPTAPSLGRHLEFLALDGTVTLQLSIDDATHTLETGSTTLTWKVCSQPWNAGDKLMLRINLNAPDQSDDISDPSCPSEEP